MRGELSEDSTTVRFNVISESKEVFVCESAIPLGLFHALTRDNKHVLEERVTC